MQDSFRQVLARLEDVSLQFRGERTDENTDDEEPPPRPVILFPEVEAAFAIEAQRRYSDLNDLPLQKALDSMLS